MHITRHLFPHSRWRLVCNAIFWSGAQTRTRTDAANLLLEMVEPASLVQILRPEYVVLMIVITC